MTQSTEYLNFHPSSFIFHLFSILGLIVLGIMFAAPPAVLAADAPRFFYSGDGLIKLTSAKSGRSFNGRYREGANQYKPEALKAIRAAFDAPGDDPMAAISLRLIEFIDFLQDHFKPDAVIRVDSGWRSPEYNTRLRKAGQLAATASLHQYGMAADIEIKGVSSRKIWDYVRKLGFGGAGYYHGESMHVDVGPARSWDETTSGVGTGISDDNKLVGLVTDFDRYSPGEEVVLRFIRMTAFPIGVAQQWTLIQESHGAETHFADISFKPAFPAKAEAACPNFKDIAAMMNFRWHLPQTLPPGRYQIQAAFCDKSWPVMPDKVQTALFEIVGP